MSDFRVVIDISDTTGADVDALAEDILATYSHDHGGNYELSVLTWQRVDGKLFGREPGDDEIGA